MMRSFFTLILILALAVASHAQMQKGSWMLDGQAGTYRSKYEESQSSPFGSGSILYDQHRGANFYLQPGVGYFVKENWAVGLSGNFQVVNGKSLDENDEEAAKGGQRTYGLGVFSRRYVPLSERLALYGDLRVGGYLRRHFSIDLDSDERTVDSNIKGLDATASIGLQYLVTDFLGVHLQSSLIDYDLSKETAVNYEGTHRRSDLTGGLFSSFQIGASFFF